MTSLKEIGIAVAAFLVEYFVAVVVIEDLVEVYVASDIANLVAGVTAAVAVVVAFADVVFDDDYIVCVSVDVVAVAGYVILFVVVAVDDAGVPAAAHVDAYDLSNNFWIHDLVSFVYLVYDLYILFLPLLKLIV